MFRRPKFLLLAVFLVLALAFAQSEERIITIDFSGGSQSAPDLRYGPFVYTHPEPEGIVATVSNLTIYAPNAELAAPEGVLIAEAEGQRTASFADGVRVERGRLEADGPGLIYSETTGLGVMSGPAAVVVAPTDEEDDPVNIGADEVTFDVDTDVSTSRGNVTLESGNQSAVAEELVFEEERNLAKLTSEGGQVTVTTAGRRRRRPDHRRRRRAGLDRGGPAALEKQRDRRRRRHHLHGRPGVFRRRHLAGRDHRQPGGLGERGAGHHPVGRAALAAHRHRRGRGDRRFRAQQLRRGGF